MGKGEAGRGRHGTASGAAGRAAGRAATRAAARAVAVAPPSVGGHDSSPPHRPPRHDRRRGRPPRAAAAILEGDVKRGGTAPRRRDVLPQHPWIGPDACPRAAVLPPTARVEVSGGSVR